MPITFSATLNPLKTDEELAGKFDDAQPDSVLKFILKDDQNAFTRRFKDIAAAPNLLPIVPAEPTIMEKLVSPLRHAKASYLLSNYLGCIALCGLVSEMVAILIWDISKVQFGGERITAKQQNDIFGSTFERLGQDKRVKVLSGLKLIDDGTKQAFDAIRKIRRQYLHFLSGAHTTIARDARQAYDGALIVVAMVLGARKFEKGAVVLREDLINYLVEKGIARRAD